MHRTRMTLALAGLAVTVGLSATATASALEVRACREIPGFGCGILTVPLDRSGTLPGTLDLRFAVGTGRQARHRPLLVALTGGPGQGGVQAARGFSFSLAPMLRRYRLAVVDQRGTGRSDPLDCPALQRIRAPAAITADEVARCSDAVGPRRAFYTTVDSVADLDALRAGLGAERIALMGVSYGTYVAQQYARVHPDRVERLILDSVVPPAGVDPFQLESFRALDRVLREQCAREACAGVTSDPVADVGALVTRMDGGEPITGRVFDARGRPRRERYRMSDELFDLLVAGDLNQYLQPALPSAIRAAVRGDPAPILRLRRIGLGGSVKPSELSLAVEVITGCEDSRLPYPFTAPVEERINLTERAVAALPAAELAPFAVDTVRRLSNAQGCLFFPPDSVSPPATGPLPDVPALVLGGRLDIRTPLEGARQVAAELPRAQVVAVPGTGHDALDNDVSGCTQAALRRFAAGRRVGRPCAGVTNAVGVVPLPPRSVRDYRAAPGVPGVRGRVVAAVVDTAYDATLAVLQNVFAGFHEIRGGGLRGGSFHGDDQGNVWLRRYALVPGLRVTGRFDSAAESPAGRLKVDGPGKLDGILRLKTDGAVRGRLGGRSVRSPATFTITAQAGAAAAGRRTARRRLSGPDSPGPLRWRWRPRSRIPMR
jgi:pimeloyl-ACP methyl ester carboxylesterase